MSQLVQVIESIRARLDDLRKRSLKETSTRTIVIDPLLEALGWAICDPDEVQLEYPAVGGQSVDYALKINGKPVLLVEAKALDDPLNDIKAVTQVVGYAANNGIVWCILTNGVKWQVYRSIEQCAAPDKLMFEVSLDPRDSEGVPVEQLAQLMRLFSREELLTGSLDDVATDKKVHKALHGIMCNPPGPFLNIIRKAMGDENLAPVKMRESLARIAAALGSILETPQIKPSTGSKTGEVQQEPGDENDHIAGKSQEVAELYQAIDRVCLSMATDGIGKQYMKKYISYSRGKHIFCCVHVLHGGLRVWLKLKHASIANPPAFARDVSSVGHWGTGDLQLNIGSLSQVEEAAALIRKSFESQG